MFLPICLQISLLLVCSMSPTCLTIGLGCLCRCSAALYIPLLLVCLTHNTPSPNVGTGCKRSNSLSFVSSSCFFDIVICDFQHLAHCNLFFQHPHALCQVLHPSRLAARSFVSDNFASASCRFHAALRIDLRRYPAASSGSRFVSAGLQRVSMPQIEFQR